MLHVSNDMEAVVSHKGQSHHAISDLTLISQPSPVAQLVEHPLRKWKVLGSSPGWVKTFQKDDMGGLARGILGQCTVSKDGMTLSRSAVINASAAALS